MNNEEKIMTMLEALAADVSGIKEEQRGFKEEQQGVREEQRGIKEELQGVREEQRGFKEELQGVREEQRGFKEELLGVREEQRGFREELQEIKAIQLRMENEHGEKLDALFDGYKLLYDVVGEIRTDAALTKSILAKHDLQIRWTDSQRKTS